MVVHQRVQIFTVPKEARYLLMTRFFVGSSAVIGFFYALTLTVATKATLLYNLQPIFLAVMAYIFLKESLDLIDMITLIGAFIGVAFISLKNDTENLEISYFLQVVGISL